MQKFPKYMLPLGALAVMPGCNDGPTPEARLPKNPNILFVTISDIGYYDFGYTGSDFYETPNIDYLASAGMQFSNAYSCAANSSPSRASMITGQFTPRFGIYSTDFTGTEAYMRLAQARANKTLPTSAYTLAEAFRDNGYTTITVGDWDPLDPTYQGYDSIDDFGGSGSGSSEPVSDDPKWLKAETESMCAFIDQAVASGKPFFGALSYHAIHTPIQATREYLDYFGAKTPGTRHNRVDYAALIKSMDDAVGALVLHLQDLGIEDNTIVVLTSDHGSVFYSTQEPNRGFKGMVYEGGIRIPLLFYCPEYISKGVCGMPVAGVDLYPTMLGLAGVKSPDVDGISLCDYVLGHSAAPAQRPEPMYWHMPGYLAIGNYKNAGSRDQQFRQRPCSVVRDGDWKLILYYEEWLLDGGWDARETNRSIELYNIREDVSESHNRANEEPEVRDRLIRQLLKWVEDTKAPIPEFRKEEDIVHDDTPVTFPVSWPLGNGACKTASMPYWESRGYWASPSQPSAYMQFSWGERPASEAAAGILPVLSITNSDAISSPSSKYFWTGDCFEFVLPVADFKAGTTVTMKFPFYGRQQPIFWDISYLDGDEWKCNRSAQTSYDDSVTMDCTLALVRGGKIIEHDMTFANAVDEGALKFRLTCVDGRYQAATASAIAVREAPNVELGGDTVCYFHCAGSGVNSISFSIKQ